VLRTGLRGAPSWIAPPWSAGLTWTSPQIGDPCAGEKGPRAMRACPRRAVNYWHGTRRPCGRPRLPPRSGKFHPKFCSMRPTVWRPRARLTCAAPRQSHSSDWGDVWLTSALGKW